MEFINGQMVKNILDSGFRIRCMVKVLLNGQMGIDMLEIIREIKRMDKGFSTFQMVKLSRVLGFKENNMELVCLQN